MKLDFLMRATIALAGLSPSSARLARLLSVAQAVEIVNPSYVRAPFEVGFVTALPEFPAGFKSRSRKRRRHWRRQLVKAHLQSIVPSPDCLKLRRPMIPHEWRGETEFTEPNEITRYRSLD